MNCITNSKLDDLRGALRALADPAIAAHAQRFFKTGPGEYGEGDRFLGIRVPVLRKTAGAYRGMPRSEALRLLRSPWHEERLCALFLLVGGYRRGDERERAAIYRAYLAHTKYINNWDLVDSSAHKIVGPHLAGKDRKPLFELARSPSLWERRIAIMSTCHFIAHHDFQTTLELAEILIDDPEDLIHKAVGWMLREVGNRNRAVEEAFLKKHLPIMPRTMLRYAIEKFPEPLRKRYLAGRV